MSSDLKNESESGTMKEIILVPETLRTRRGKESQYGAAQRVRRENEKMRQELGMESLIQQEVFKEHSRCRIQNEFVAGKKSRCENN